MPPEPGESIAVSPMEPAIYEASPDKGRFCQGEVLESVLEWVPVYTAQRAVEGTKPSVHQLAVVFGQDCDLVQDWRERQDDQDAETELRSIILCPARAAEVLRKEHHLNRKLFEQIRLNKLDRYQYLDAIPNNHDRCKKGHPPMLVDFKNYFTVRTVELYRQAAGADDPPLSRRARLATPWREHLQLRFAMFHARIGLPRDHFTPLSRRVPLPSPSVTASDFAAPTPS